MNLLLLLFDLFSILVKFFCESEFHTGMPPQVRIRIVLSEPENDFHGNHYLNDSEEHFSTREPAILNLDEIEPGRYEIVTVAFAEVVEIATFTLVRSRDISPDSSDFTFTHAASCTPCAGTCDFGNIHLQMRITNAYWSVMSNCSPNRSPVSRSCDSIIYCSSA
jgi:hypothetical protein